MENSSKAALLGSMLLDACKIKVLRFLQNLSEGGRKLPCMGALPGYSILRGISLMGRQATWATYSQGRCLTVSKDKPLLGRDFSTKPGFTPFQAAGD